MGSLITSLIHVEHLVLESEKNQQTSCPLKSSETQHFCLSESSEIYPKTAPQFGHRRCLINRQQRIPSGKKRMAQRTPRHVKSSSNTPTWKGHQLNLQLSRRTEFSKAETVYLLCTRLHSLFKNYLPCMLGILRQLLPFVEVVRVGLLQHLEAQRDACRKAVVLQEGSQEVQHNLQELHPGNCL